jgi:hypothetical protein
MRALLPRALLFVLPVAALLLALPEVPHIAVTVLVPVFAAQWARVPDHVTGTLALVLVMGWWSAHGVVDWRLPVVALLLVLAHVVATVLALGPGTMRIDPRVVRLWALRGAMSLVPLAIAFVAVTGLDAGLAPPWLWILAALVLVGLTLSASRLTQVVAEE